MLFCYGADDDVVGCRQSFDVQLEEVTNIASLVVICPDLMRRVTFPCKQRSPEM